MKHTYSFTYESYSGDIVIGSAEVQVKYTFSPGRPMKMYLRNGDPGYPAEGPEIEITDVLVEEWADGLGKDARYDYRPADNDEYDLFSEYAMDKRFDDMVEEASRIFDE